MPPSLPDWYEQMLKYTKKSGVTIFIDSDALNIPAGIGKKFFYDEEKNHLIIDGSRLTSNEEDALSKLLVESQEEGVDIINIEQEELIENWEGYSDSYNPYKDTIQLLSPLIPSQDLFALKMAYFMRIKNDAGEDIKEYRRQIRDRFGLRGLYISNLCQSSYFENQFRARALKLDNAKFKEYYELRVGMELAALFVHNGMTKKILEQSLLERLIECSKNEVFIFRIHAMGGENVNLAKSVVRPLFLNENGIEGEIKTLTESLYHPVYIDMEISLS